MTTAHEVITPFSARALRPEDAGTVAELMADCERHDLGEALIELDDIVADWQRPSFALATDSLGFFHRSQLVGYGEVYRARRAEIFVHPDVRGRGLGTALMRWTWRLAAERGGTIVGQTVPETQLDAIALFRANGYRPIWTSWILELPEGTEIATVDSSSAQARIRPFRPGYDEHAAYQVIEDAFGEWPDRESTSYDDWAAGVVLRPGFQPWQLLLAVEPADDHEQVVGVCFVVPSGDTGWVHQIAVRRDRRGRGLARSLLLRAFAEARAHGATRAELSTDSRTGALGLYEHVGMRVKQSFVHYARDLDPTVTSG